MTTKTTEILPAAWNHDRRANGFSLVILSNQAYNGSTNINLEIVAGEPDTSEAAEEPIFMHIHTGSTDTADGWTGDIGDTEFEKCVADGSLLRVMKEDGVWVEYVESDGITYRWTVEIGDEILAEGDGCDSAQEAADDAAELLATWLQKKATTEEMLRFVEVMGDGRNRQAEIAEILGVSQPTVSMWEDGKREMSKAVRTHIMRMMGIKRTPGAGGTAKWAIFK